MAQISVDREILAVLDASMQEQQYAAFGVGVRRRSGRSVRYAIFAALALSMTGCTLTLSPLAKHTAEFSAAAGSLADGSKRAYFAANQLHENAQISVAIDSYDTPGWRPDAPLKPLLTPEQMAARIKVLDALKAYAQALEGLTETKKRDQALGDAAASAGANLQSLTAGGAQDLHSVFPGLASMSGSEASGVSTAIVALGELLSNGRARKALGQTTAEMDPSIQALCGLIESDARALAAQADIDYKAPIQDLNQFLGKNQDLDPLGRRTVIGRMIALAQQEKLNDRMLAKLDESVSALAKAHGALTDAAAGKGPETIKERLQELISLATELGEYYSSLQATGASGPI